MKKVVNNEELKKVMQKTINLLANTVKATLGPSGKNVIIDGEYLSPFITNDGVTIAEQISSDDEVENAILKIAKEASIKTNELVGDGTTTSLVLMQSIFNEGLSSTINPIKLKKDIDESLTKILSKIEEESKTPNEKDIINIATISSGDEKIGNIVGNAYNRVGKYGTVVVEESNTPGIKLDIKEGLIIKNCLANNFMLNDTVEYLNEPYILITNNKINNMDDIENIINEIIETKKELLLIAESYSEDVLSNLVLLKEQNLLNVIALNAPEYGKKQLEILTDISIFTNANLINKYKKEKLSDLMIVDLGEANKIKVTKDEVTIIEGLENKKLLNNRKEVIIKQINESDSNFEKEYLLERLSNLNNASAVITIGDNTKVEMLEKKMRIEDAICSCKSALTGGILPGGGLALLKTSNYFNNNENTEGMNILLKAMKEPFKQIIENIGLNSEEIYEEIEKQNFLLGVDAKSLKYVDMINEGIIDSKEVVMTSLINAVSISTMLLTTESIVINSGNIKTEETQVF